MTVRLDKPVVDIEALTFSFGRTTILDDFTVALARGEVTAIVGPSGCGKTTLLRLIAGLEHIQTGRITISAGDNQTPISFLLQDYDAFPWMTVRNNLALSGETRDSIVDELASKLGLAGMLDRYPRQLSGGQKKRVALARCILASPALLLMDEPFGSLDVRTKIAIFELFETTYLAPERAGLFVTHSVEEAVILSDRVLVLTGPPLRIIEDIRIDEARPRGMDFINSSVFKAAEAEILNALLTGATAERLSSEQNTISE